MASKARNQDFVDMVRKLTKEGHLAPCRGLMKDLMSVPRVSGKEMVQLVLDQVNLAKERQRNQWLREVAHDALVLQFHSRAWISENIFSLGKEKRKQSKVDRPTGRSRDIRLLTDPNLERREENAAETESVSVPVPTPTEPREDERLLMDVSVVSSVPSEEERLLLSEGEGVGQPPMEQAIEPHPMVVEAEPTRDCRMETVTVNLEAKIVPEGHARNIELGAGSVESSPVRQVASVQRKGVSRKPRDPKGSRSLFRDPKGSRSLFRQTVPSERTDTGRPRSPLQEISQSRNPECQTKSGKRRRLDNLTLPVVALEKSSSKEALTSHSDLRITVTQEARGSSISQGQGRTIRVVKSQKEAMDLQQERQPYDQRRSHFRKERRREQLSVCPVPCCEVHAGYPKRHAFEYHVPSLFEEGLDVEDVTSRRLAALKLAALWLLGPRSTVQELTAYVNVMGLLSGDSNKEVTEKQSVAMRALCIKMGVDPPKVFTLCPMNSPACLIHWKALLLVVAQFEPRHRQNFMDQFQYTPVQPVCPEVLEVNIVPADQSLPCGYDSHFHLDRSLDHHRMPRTASLKELCAKV